MFDAFFNAIAALMAWFYELPLVGGSIGMAIILLTLTIMLVVTPLNVKATRSMMAMSAMAPEMKKIQQEFADDRVRMNEELLAFYRENKINPVGSCLPMLLQIPFFIVLYQVIYGLTRRAGEATVAANGAQVAEGGFLPKYLDQMPDSQLYTDLVGKTSMDFLELDLARSAATALQDSFGQGLPYMVMILAVAGTAFLQQKQMSLRNPNAEIPQNQKILLRVMPVFFAFISFNFAAGLVLYFFISNIYRIFQNAAISMHLYGLSGPQALLGIGVASMPGGTTSGDDEPKPKPSSGPAKKSPPAKGSSNNGRKAPGKKNDSAGKNNAAGRDKPARPPSGRVTPPKSAGQRPASSPPRRKKKRN